MAENRIARAVRTRAARKQAALIARLAGLEADSASKLGELEAKQGNARAEQWLVSALGTVAASPLALPTAAYAALPGRVTSFINQACHVIGGALAVFGGIAIVYAFAMHQGAQAKIEAAGVLGLGAAIFVAGPAFTSVLNQS